MAQVALPALGLLVAHLVVKRVLERRRTNVHLLPTAPREDASWIYGHELVAWEHNESEMHTRWLNQVGQVYRAKAAFGHDDLLVIGDHAAAHHIFMNTDTYIKSPAFANHVANLLGHGIVVAEGEEHRLMRRVIAPCFSASSVRDMSDVILDSTEKMISNLTQLLRTGGGDEVNVNIGEYTTVVTLDVIARVSFGHDFFPDNTPTEDAKHIASSWNVIVESGDTFAAFCALPLIRRFPWIMKLPADALRTQGVTKVTVTRLAKELLARGGELGGKDLFSRMIREMRTDNEKDVPGEKLTEEQVIDNIVTFMLVGHETSSVSIKFTLLELARRPEMQQRLREEIMRNGGTLGYEEVQAERMPFLDAIIKEGLRVYPAAPLTDRIADHDDVIPLRRPIVRADGTYLREVRVKKGQVVIVQFKAMNMDESVWGLDAQEFKPERWLTAGGVPPASDLPTGWSGMMSFSDGQRSCIGYRLALLEMKIIIAALVKQFVWRDTGADVQRRISPTLQAKIDGKIGQLPMYMSLAS